MYNIIGKGVAHVNGYEKVTGRAVYSDNILLPDMLHAECRCTGYIPIIKAVNAAARKTIRG